MADAIVVYSAYDGVMGRDPRVWEAGAVYHAVPKGNDGKRIFLDNRDRLNFLGRFGDGVEACEATLVGYCLMDTHAHALIVSGELGLSDLFEVVLGGYSRWWNRRHRHEGHNFRGRVFAAHVDTDAYFWNAARYIDMNPVAAGVVHEPQHWQWSSFRAHAGLTLPPSFLDVTEFLSYFGAKTGWARDNYLRFVRAWRPPAAYDRDPIRAATLLQTACAEEDPDAPYARALLGLPEIGATAVRGQDFPGRGRPNRMRAL
jgi:REP element-mobilizing transposase RayT